MKYAGPVASKLGISLEEAAGMAGILANNGLRGSDAGTAMRASLARLASPTAGAAKALKQLGVSVSDAVKCDQLKLFFSTSTRQLKIRTS
jgi:TP901 family phage tail tape measure protein